MERVNDGWSPDRRELREVITRLRRQYGRRRLFRVADVENILWQMRLEEAPPVTVLRMAPRTVERPPPLPPGFRVRIETVDLTADELMDPESVE